MMIKKFVMTVLCASTLMACTSTTTQQASANDGWRFSRAEMEDDAKHEI